ncbi:glycosyltransferase family 4 protein [Pseudoflavitalea sp. G-6-1-2]|uniref:glycosyltransferase n=1 Tax=Pseudoflavitalea sp. G-6-1-2 TaxID=2728841 RepID=UPI00146BE874|nr:glycosyltransferase [Pseudoflavitalea sp. G-6-1-2]NML21815.1 glycosyltransferase family 4 protein [Pseudoflavitalea sp. G-6-1-2]
MIKVLSIASYQFLPPRMGGQKGIALFYKYFSKECSLSMVTTQSNDPALAEGYELLNILSNSPLRYVNIFYFFTLRNIIRRKKITHLILEHPYYGWLGILLKWFTGVKLIVHSHNIEGLRWKTLHKWWWKILWQYERYVHRRANHSFFIQEQDRQYAISRFGLKPSKCTVVTYGIEWDTPPTLTAHQQSRQWLQQQHHIPEHHQILLFNGAFNYAPNVEALEMIIQKVNPLLQQSAMPYTLLICGKDIPAHIVNAATPNMVIAGFVPDIDIYFRGADIFLNPLISGGGIKTKLVEALGNNLNAVSTVNGAEGVDAALCGGKLQIVADDDWKGFSEKVIELSNIKITMPADFFAQFYWGSISAKALAALKS